MAEVLDAQEEKIYEALQKMFDEDKRRSVMLNPVAVHRIYEIVNRLRRLQTPDSSVELSLGGVLKTVGAVTYEGETAMFSDSSYLAAILDLSDGFDIFPIKEPYRFRMVFTVYDTAVYLPEGSFAV